MLHDTIAAPATAASVPAAIGIIRVSGADSAAILRRVLALGESGGAAPVPRMMSLGRVVDAASRAIVDEVMYCFFAAPRSYTGEDMVEFYCHGGVYNMQRVMRAVLEAGARYAGPGEFTRRACINGKMDICQAEAILDLIDSGTGALHDAAISQMKGSLSNSVNDMRNTIAGVLAEIEANLDFPEDDVDPLDMRSIAARVAEARSRASRLLETYEYGKVLRRGLRVVIAGSPNSGKSSLFNLLLREERAIVTEVPGTTRDVIEETVNIGGVPYVLVDTAGLRETGDAVEKIGTGRAIGEIEKADLALVLLDSSRPVSAEDSVVLDRTQDRPRLVVMNKIDIRTEGFYVADRLLPGEEVLKISVRENILVDELREAIAAKCGLSARASSGPVVVTNARHAAALASAAGALEEAIASIDAGAPVDLLSIDLRTALSHLGEIVGETLTEDILHRIFEKFCIGK